ncbi:MAG: DUF1819 family protein [bacterium]|nr:DUF1819 family protein [bacterium]
MGKEYTSRLLKGGAVLEDTLRVVELWVPGLSPDENLHRISSENLLGKPSRARIDDLLYWVIQRRYVEPGSHLLPALKGLVPDRRAFTEACYYETSRDDDLLAAFAEGPIWERWRQGRLSVEIHDALGWLGELAKSGKVPEWSESVRSRSAQGLLSTLRDFGILTGATGGRRKEIAPPAMTPRGFAYVLWREHEQGASSHALATSRVWRRWLLNEEMVEDLFVRAALLGVLRFSRAGSSVRVDWLVERLEEVTGAAA